MKLERKLREWRLIRQDAFQKEKSERWSIEELSSTVPELPVGCSMSVGSK